MENQRILHWEGIGQAIDQRRRAVPDDNGLFRQVVEASQIADEALRMHLRVAADPAQMRAQGAQDSGRRTQRIDIAAEVDDRLWPQFVLLGHFIDVTAVDLFHEVSYVFPLPLGEGQGEGTAFAPCTALSRQARELDIAQELSAPAPQNRPEQD